MEWIEITDAARIPALKADSILHKENKFIIFKHSTRCGTSRMAKNMFDSEWNANTPVYLVNVVESRQVSNAVETEFDVSHESPQVLLIENGICTYHTSHSGIDAAELKKRLQSEPA